MKTTCSRCTDLADVTATKAWTIWPLLPQDYHPRNFSVRLWDGSQWPRRSIRPVANWFLNTPKHYGACRGMLPLISLSAKLTSVIIWRLGETLKKQFWCCSSLIKGRAAADSRGFVFASLGTSGGPRCIVHSKRLRDP